MSDQTSSPRVPAPLDPRSSILNTDVLFRDHSVVLNCVRTVLSVTVEPSAIEFHCSTVRIRRSMRDRYGTNLEIADEDGPGPAVTVRLDAVNDHVLRLRMARGEGVPENDTPMVVSGPSDDAAIEVVEGNGYWTVRSGSLETQVWADPFRYVMRTTEGTVLRETIPAAVYQRPPTGESHIDGAALSDAWPWFFRDLAPLGFMENEDTGETQAFETAFLGQDEHLYGFGERFGTLDKRGQAIHLWHANPAGKTWPLSYKNVPFFVSTLGYGHFTNSSRPITYHCGDLSHIHHSVHVQDSFLDTYLVAGPDLRDVLERYTDLTGKPQVPPAWTFGLWMSRMSYREQHEVESVAQRLREEQIPSDVIHIDTDWFATEWVNDLEFSAERFPDPAGMIRDLRDQGFRITLWQIPYISVKSRFFEICARNGWFARKEDGSPRLIDGFFGEAGVIDFSHPQAADWYAAQLAPLFDMGVAAIKTDFGEGAPIDALYHAGDGVDMHNLYPLLYNKAVFEKTVELTGEPIIWGRSAYAGSQRYPMYWGGDPAARWQDLGQLLAGGLGLGMCGFPYWSQDIGGFAGTPSSELYVRWAQMGLFMTHPRAHGPIAREPWAFGEQAVDIFRTYARLRYRLLPYIVSEAESLAPVGQPLMRPMLLDHQDDPTTWHISDQFIFGRELLVAPVLQEASTRRVYLPKGKWVHWNPHQNGAYGTYSGPGWITVQAPLEELPLFIPEGGMLPLVDPVQHSAEIEYHHMDLHLVPGPSRRSALTMPGREPISFALTCAGGADRAIRVEIDPQVRWTLYIHGLDDLPTQITSITGEVLAWTAMSGGSIEIDCPAGTAALDIIQKESQG